MKYLNYIFILLLISLSSCNDWLDIRPKSETGEDELFSSAQGFRGAINGIYLNCNKTSLYGKNATWGFVDALSQYYITNNGTLNQAIDYNYEYSSIISINDGIWKTAYNAILNCNNLIDNIRNTSVSDFIENEKDMIEGEALGMRAYLCFDLLRLYVPYENIKNDGIAIPYPQHKVLVPYDRLNASEVIKNIKDDLIKASQLLAKVDTTEGIRQDMSSPSYRFRTCSTPKETSYRGYRFNYYASLALLARVNAYIGEKEEAYNYAKKVVDSEIFEFSDENDVFGDVDNRDVKLAKGVIFGLHDMELTKNFDYYTKKVTYYTSYIYLKEMESLFDDNGTSENSNDIRFKKLISQTTDKHYYSLKHTSSENGTKERDERPLIPMLRLSEMYYIMSEYLIGIDAEREKAFGLMDELRLNRGIISKFDSQISNENFIEEIIKDARKEFISEGQLFYLYKRLNHAIKVGDQVIQPEDIKFTLPYPNCETSL